jgi:YVTN family beta-propeller protein
MNKSKVLIKISMIIFVLSSLVYSQPVTTIQGTVTDISDDALIDSAHISIFRDDGDNSWAFVYFGYSDPSGSYNFAIESFPYAPIRFFVWHAGYDSLIVDYGYIESGSTVTIDFELTRVPIFVSNTDNDGPGSLRQAITDANARSGVDRIHFNIAGTPPHSIQPSTTLPTINEPVVVDGTTQPGYAGTPIIELDGSSAGAISWGLWISKGPSTVKGMVINRFTDAIFISTPDIGLDEYNIIQGNYIGTDVTGTSPLPNTYGINLSGPNNIIGGNSPEERNIISGNLQYGIVIQSADATDNQVIGNYIGTDISGTGDLGNQWSGISISAPNNIIGGNSPEERNIISGNGWSGVDIHFSISENNYIQGNYIGLNADGSATIGNSQEGIVVDEATSNWIIGNYISGNDGNGILLQNDANYNKIEGNHIGTDINGTVPLGNGAAGIRLESAHGNRIGNSIFSERNIISGNQNQGIILYTSDQDTIINNFIGTDRSGMIAMPNDMGIYLIGSSTNIIGGYVAALRNVISGNNNFGVSIQPTFDGGVPDIQSSGNIIVGNYIGLKMTGVEALSNGDDGVNINFASGNTVIGNVLSAAGFISTPNNGVEIGGYAAQNNVVQANYIGTDSTGMVTDPDGIPDSGDELGNKFHGISIWDAPNNLIGGTNASARNIISGNLADGIAIEGNTAIGNTIIGNYIGTDINGDTPLGNINHGIYLSGAPNNSIGGKSLDSANVISGNGYDGIEIGTIGATGNRVLGNFIGTDATGASAVKNDGAGIRINDAPDNIIGGTDPGAKNVIYGGITISNPEAQRNRVIGNYIGVDITGTNALGNEPISGIWIEDASENDIGPMNVISGHDEHGVMMYNAGCTANRVFGNLIGTNYDGTIAIPNRYGVSIMNAPDNYIGSITGAGNVISGNLTEGVHIEGALAIGNLVQGNYIGLNRTGSEALGNGSDGILISAGAHDIQIGGSDLGARNIISGNVSNGIASYDQSYNIKIYGNYIGTDSKGVIPLGNSNGISWDGGYNNIIGGMSTGEGNLISGNTNNGILLEAVSGLPFQNNSIQGNFIGTDRSGGGPLGNQNNGIQIGDNVQNNFIGGINRNAGNIIAFNGNYGIVSDGTSIPGIGNVFLSNSIHSNGNLGIDLGGDGVTPNDAGDVDPGTNNLQNFPELTLMHFEPGKVTIEGTLNSAAGNDFYLQFFANRVGDPFGYGEGEKIIGMDTVTTDAGGNVTFTFTFPLSINGGRVITATATDLNNNTSEFSRYAGGSEQPVVEDGLFPMHYVINENGEPSISDGSDITAIVNAYQHWEDIGTSEASFFFDSLTTDWEASAEDGINLVTFSDDGLHLPPGVLAVTAKTIIEDPNEQTAYIVDADIVFNPSWIHHPDYNFGTDTKEGAWDIESIATHEIGHVLGLLHTGVETATMFFILQPEQEARTLETDDIAWASFLYQSDSYLSTFGSISGQVKDGYSEQFESPVAGALLLAANETNSDSIHAYSNDEGNYHIPGLVPGNYKISMQPLDGDVHEKPLLPGHISPYVLGNTRVTDFPHEFYDENESDIDDPSVYTPVSVSLATQPNQINLITNRDIIPPEIVHIFPEPDDSEFLVTDDIEIRFSEPVDRLSFENAFRLTIGGSLNEGGTVVPGTYDFINEYGDLLVLFTPLEPLDFLTEYTINISSALTDIRGNNLTAEMVSNFMTSDADTEPPSLVQIDPEHEADSVFVTKKITLGFSEPMDRHTFTVKTSQDDGNFSLSSNGNFVNGSFQFDRNYKIAVFTPFRPLAEGTLYTVNLSTDITDLSGMGLENEYIKTFTTVPDGPPAMTKLGPADGATDISITTKLFADFSEPIDPSTVNSNTFFLSSSASGTVSGVYEFLYDNSRIIFRPDQNLSPDVQYTFTVTQGITDLSENPLDQEYISNFITASEITTPAIWGIIEPRAPIGANVVISGEGFDPNPDNNIVLFREIPANVIDATLNSLRVKVPQDATTGDVTVTVNGERSNAYPFYLATLSDDNANVVIANRQTELGGRDAAPLPDGTYAYVVSSTYNSVSVINLNEEEDLPSIEVGIQPMKIDINTSGTRAYVTNYLSNSVSVIDTDPTSDTRNQVIYTIEQVGLNPIGVGITPDGSRVYVANYTSQDISVIDVVENSGTFNRVIANRRTDTKNKDLDINPDGTLAFVTSTNGILILDIDPDTDSQEGYNSVIARARSEKETDEVTILPDGTLAFATTTDGDIIIIDALIGSPRFGAVIANVKTEKRAKDLDLSPDGLFLYVTNFYDNTVTVYEVTYFYGESYMGAQVNIGEDQPVVVANITLTWVTEIYVGEAPYGIIIDPVGYKAIVTIPGSDFVSIIDISSTGAPLPVETVYSLIIDVRELIIDGSLSHGDGNSLLAKLNSVQEVLEQGDLKAAKNKLNEFIKKVNNLVNKGRLTPEDGQYLIDAANNVIDDIDNYMKKVRGKEKQIIPQIFALGQNYPNPFNAATIIFYDIPGSASEGVQVHIQLFNILGQVARTLVDEHKLPGRHMVTWDSKDAHGSPVASGIYIYRIEAGEFQDVKKMVLIR